MMVMLRRPGEQVAAAAVLGAQLTDESKLGKDVERAVHRHQSNTGMLPTYPVVYVRWGQVFIGASYDLQNRPPLRCKTVASVSQGSYSSFQSIPLRGLDENYFHLQC